MSLIKKTVKSTRVGPPRQVKRKRVSAAAAKRRVAGKKKRRAR